MGEFMSRKCCCSWGHGFLATTEKAPHMESDDSHVSQPGGNASNRKYHIPASKRARTSVTCSRDRDGLEQWGANGEHLFPAFVQRHAGTVHVVPIGPVRAAGVVVAWGEYCDRVRIIAVTAMRSATIAAVLAFSRRLRETTSLWSGTPWREAAFAP